MLVAPAWAERGAGYPGFDDPDPARLGAFAFAAAKRYGGEMGGTLRVREWEAWNEPNVSYFLRPQLDAAGRVLSVGLYRELLRAFADGVHAAAPGDVVVAGNTFPFGFSDPAQQAVAPLAFARSLLCLGPDTASDPVGCAEPLHFDVWAHHPYTNGGPTTASSGPGNVSLGNLRELRTLLDDAKAAGRIVTSRRRVGLWVNEFSWDSDPPDPGGVDASVLRRWVPEAMRTSWRAGADRFTWFLLRDQATGTSRFQSGMWYRCGRGLGCDKAKPQLPAFRFGFAVEPTAGGAPVWARAPRGRRIPIVVERATKRGWQFVAKLRPSRYGIVQDRVRVARGSRLRARLAGRRTVSPSVSVTETPSVPATPFGG